MDNMEELCYGETTVRTRSILHTDYSMKCYKRRSLCVDYTMVLMHVIYIQNTIERRLKPVFNIM